MKRVLLVGLGRFGRHVAMKLHELKHYVMAIDQNEDQVDQALAYVTDARIGNCTSKKLVDSLHVENYDVCIVAIGDSFQDSLEVTSLLKECGAKQVVSRVVSDIQEKILLRNGADEVVYSEKQMARWTAIRYTADHILDYVVLDDIHGIFEVSVPEAWIGKKISQIDIRKKYKFNIMGIKRGKEMDLSVLPDMVLTEDISLYILGKIQDIQKCFQ